MILATTAKTNSNDIRHGSALLWPFYDYSTAYKAPHLLPYLLIGDKFNV